MRAGSRSNFFRLRLPYSIHERIIHGATLMSLAPDEGDVHCFRRWSAYMGSGVEAKIDHAIDELLMRLERIPFASFSLIDPTGDRARGARADSPGRRRCRTRRRRA